jgi:carbohydrate binding protein with CBM11 domain
MRPRRLASLAVVVVAGLLAARVALWRPLAVTGEAPGDGYTRVAGVVHVHTTLSDGGGSPDEVIAAARRAGLGFVVLTDHNHLDGKALEGYHDGVLVLVGSELSTTAGHVLGLGIPDPAFRFSGDPRDVLEDVRDLGGFSFAAHPFSPRDDLRFTGWDLPGPWGLELINGDSEWRRAGVRNLLTAALYGLNHRYALLESLNPPDEVLARWDRLLAERDVPAIAGADAHSRLPLTRTRAVRFPSYESLFALTRTHVLLSTPLTGDASRDGAAVLEALRRGRSYVGIDALAAADAVSFTVEGAGGRWTMGESATLGRGLVARVRGLMPAGARVALLRDGRLLREGDSPGLEAPLPGPGVYRVEVRVPGTRVPWVLTNAIAVFDPETQKARAARADWPAAGPPPARALLIEDFRGKAAVFKPEFDPSSWMDPRVVDPGAGPEGGPAGRLAFRLGAPGPGRPFTWCALVDRQAPDLAGRTGLVFRIKGDGEYRAWVQLRDLNPASADDGLEWWMASVRSTAEWRTVTLPFGRFRTINKKTDGKLDLDKVRQIVFVLDHAAVKTGTTGTIWLSDVGAY